MKNEAQNTKKCVALKAHAKINLTLEVLGERPDGYHELRTVMHSIGLSDIVRLEAFSAPICGERIIVECSEPLPERNTARRSAEAYFARAERIGLDACTGVRIRITKGIPSEAGLGGASADAAAVLFGMERLFGALGNEQLFEIGACIGADVPFCLHGGCALCEGIGERLTALPAVRLPLLVVKGERGVSTAALFRSLGADEQGSFGNFSGDLAEAITKTARGETPLSESSAVPMAIMNSLERVAGAAVPEIAEYRERLLSSGALGALMSGSGSSVYGIFPSLEAAKNAQPLFADCAFTAVCSTEEAAFELIG